MDSTIEGEGHLAGTLAPSDATLSHFGFMKLVVEDLEKAAVFYRKVFGLADGRRVTHDHSATTGGPIDEINFRPTAEGGASLTLIRFVDRPAPPLGETVLGFITTDLAALIERAQSAGGRLARPVRDMPEYNLKVGFVTDPEGHLIEVVQMN